MTKDEIYEHLAKVYLGKKEKIRKKKRRYFHPKLFVNITVALVVLACVFYGLTAFLSKINGPSKRSVIFALNNSPIRVTYNLNIPYPQVHDFSIFVPKIDISKYDHLTFSMRGTDEGYPGIVKILVKNRKNETSFYFVKDVDKKWKKFSIPLGDFKEITDWTDVTGVSFVFESWNVAKKKGVVLIDDVCFSS